MPQSKFTPAQAVELADAFARHSVDYLFIGKSGAILLGYPAVTQDVDLFLVDLPLLEEFRREYASMTGAMRLRSKQRGKKPHVVRQRNAEAAVNGLTPGIRQGNYCEPSPALLPP